MHLFGDEIFPEIETSDNVHHSYDTKEDQIVRYERMDEDAPPLNNDYDTEDAPPTNAPTTTISVGFKRRKGRKTTKNLKVTEPMHWVNLVANGVGNMENKLAYVSTRFPYCMHGMRF